MSRRRAFVVVGEVADVVSCACEAERLVEVPLDGWGVGAGAFAHSAAEAVERIGDLTLLFQSGYVSRLPGHGQAFAHAAADADRRLYGAYAARFRAGAPDWSAHRTGVLSQEDLLDGLVWPAFPEAAAIGCVALVRLRREDVRGALICANVARGATLLPAGRRSNDPGLRDRYFDLDPLSHVPGFESGLAWVVATSMKRAAETKVAATRFGVPGGRAVHHCHVVIPGAQSARGASAWDARSAAALSDFQVHGAEAFAFHSDDPTRFEVVSAYGWGFSRAEVHAPRPVVHAIRS